MRRPQYFQSAIPEPCRIFGLKLLPLSIGRYRLLKRFDSVFVADEEIGFNSIKDLERLMGELVIAVLVCSMRVSDFLEFIQSENCQKDLQAWSDLIREHIASDPHFSLLEKVGLFRSYIDDNSAVPEHWNENPGEGSAGTHWTHNLEIILRSELNYSAEEIEEGPLGKALFDYFKHAENSGAIRLIADGEIDAGNANASLLEAILKGGACPV